MLDDSVVKLGHAARVPGPRHRKVEAEAAIDLHFDQARREDAAAEVVGFVRDCCGIFRRINYAAGGGRYPEIAGN